MFHQILVHLKHLSSYFILCWEKKGNGTHFKMISGWIIWDFLTISFVYINFIAQTVAMGSG